MHRLAEKQGNAATEYVLLASVMVAILAGISHGTEHYCIRNLGGSLAECKSLPRVISLAFQASIEDITLLLNLPF